MSKITSETVHITDVDFVSDYIKQSDRLIDRLCLNYNVSYDDFQPICSLINELKNRLSVLQYALS